MNGVELVVAGESFEDLIFADLPRLPRPGEEVRTGRFVRTVGGGAIITAVAARRAGVRCRVVSGLSGSAVEFLARERIPVTNLRRARERHAVSAALSTRRDRAFVTFTGMNPRLEPRLFTALRRVSARHVHFAFFPSRCRRWTAVLASLRRRGIGTSWDFGWNEPLLDDRDFLALVARLDYFMVNEREAVFYARARRLRDALAFWQRHARTTIVKLGPRGSRWISREVVCEAAPPAVRVVDTTGAGDAFDGGFLAARLAGASPVRALGAGNRMGALSTRAAGGLDGLPRRRNFR